MPPVKSISTACLTRIRNLVSLSVVSILQKGNGRSECSVVQGCGTGVVLSCEDDRCVILTIKDILRDGEEIFVRFSSGDIYPAKIINSNNNSLLAALLVCNLLIKPKEAVFSKNEAKQCDVVLQLGLFDDDDADLSFSNGSVGTTGHMVMYQQRTLLRFVHNCSRRLKLIGAPVFNLSGEVVGLNFSRRVEGNLFFALSISQIQKEMALLLGKDPEEYRHLDLINPFRGIFRAMTLVDIEKSKGSKRRKIQ